MRRALTPRSLLLLAILLTAAPAFGQQWPDPLRLDSDGDELDDAREAVLGTNPALADSDGDRVRDLLDARPLDPTRSDDPFAMYLPNGVSVPPAGLDPLFTWPGTPPNNVRFVVILASPPTLTTITQLATQYGVVFQDRIPNRGFRARANGATLAALAADPRVYAIRSVPLSQKMEPQLWIHGVPATARDPGTGQATFELSFGIDIPASSIPAIIVLNGGSEILQGAQLGEWQARLSDQGLQQIFTQSLLNFVDVVRNDATDFASLERRAIGLDDASGVPVFAQTGAGVIVAQLEGGAADASHPELQTSVSPSLLFAPPTESSHATLVAGVLTGDGVDALAKGIAPDVQVRSYESFQTRIGAENRFAHISSQSGAELVNGSWGNAETLAGKYKVGAREIDRRVAAVGTAQDPITMVWAAGNGRGVLAGIADPPGPECRTVIANPADPDFGEWNCIASPATAKNALTIGAIQGGPDCATAFSAQGPTDDGRLKPELVAPGRAVYSSVQDGALGTQGEAVQSPDTCGSRDCALTHGLSARCNEECCDAPCSGGPLPECVFPNDYVIPSYDSVDGTSVAAPIVTGALAVLLEAWNDLGLPGRPRPATWKALLVGSATDLDNAGSGAAQDDGPGFANGYGALDAEAALVRLADHAAGPLLFESSVGATGQLREFPFQVLAGDVGAKPFRVTLAWDDLPGENASFATLAHDFDLSLAAPNGWVYHPWLLDPTRPGANAVCAIASAGAASALELGPCDEASGGSLADRRNNLEQVYVPFVRADQIGVWTVRVTSAYMSPWFDGAPVPSADFSIALPFDHADANADGDGDGISDLLDNCPGDPNPDQADADADTRGDVCDNCPAIANAGQENADGDAFGDVCDACTADPLNDADVDGICGDLDNCPAIANAGQENADGDDFGDVCDACAADPLNDADVDGICGDLDNCPAIANVGQENADGDAFGDVCDACAADPLNDADVDGVCGDLDNCPVTANAAQSDANGDAIGNACQCGDGSDDGLVDVLDLVLTQRDQLALEPALPAPAKCSTVAPGTCDAADIARLRDALAALPPAIEQSCPAALPPLP